MSPQNFYDTCIASSLPAPGFYPSVITTARWRRSQRGNRMVYVVHALDGVGRPHDRVPDYFVVEGLSDSGLAFVRARLVQLYRACGQAADRGTPIHPARLADARLDVKVGHELWEGRLRLRVVGYRRLDQGPTDAASTAGGPPGPVAAFAALPLRGQP